MENFDKIQKKKDSFLEKSESSLDKKVTGAERKLLDLITKDFLDKLETEDGKIVSNGKNVTLTQAIDKIFKTFDERINASLVKDYVNDIKKVSALNESYFKIFEPNAKKFKGIKDSAEKGIRTRLGLDTDGKIRRGGFLSGFLTDNTQKRQLKTMVTDAITSGQGFSQLRESVQTLTIGNKQVQGQLQSNYRQLIYDTYSQLDNFQSGLYADAIGMDAFRYAGGKIRTTRKFCCQRNGKIWTVEEAEKWQSLKFQGKTKNYNPLIDLGGYNCRHSTQYISNELTARKRKDLTLDEDGKLVKKKGEPKQKLNTGCS